MINERITLGIFSRLFEDERKPFGRQTRMFIEMFELCERHPVELYVFHQDSFEGSSWERIAEGWKWNGAAWQRISGLKLPDVVYDRGFFKGTGFEEKRRTIVDLLYGEYGKPFINSPSVSRISSDKWKSHLFLEEQGIQTPRTWLQSDISLMYEKAEDLDAGFYFIKPRLGQQGRGIFLLERCAPSPSAPDGLKVFNGQGELITIHRKYFKELVRDAAFPSGDYILQKAVFPSLRRDAFDLRMLIQKGSDGKNRITGSHVRVSMDRSVALNLSGGAYIDGVEKHLGKYLGEEEVRNVVRKTESTAMDTVELIDELVGECGELGIDFVFDDKWRPYVLELNSKPGKFAFFLLAADAGTKVAGVRYKEMRSKAVMNPVFYACFLTWEFR